MRAHFHEIWQRSRFFRIVLVLSVVYTVLRIMVQGGYLAMMLMPESGILGGVPEWAGAEGPMVPADLQIYIDAAEHIRARQAIYLQGSLERLEDHYPYAPSFALAFTTFLWLSPPGIALVNTGLHFFAYLGMYVVWFRIFQQWGFNKCERLMIWTLPVWLLFSSFWTDLGYLNIYIIVALVGSLFIRAVISENLPLAVLWLALILQVKPHWAFALIVPLLLGRYRFFSKLLGLSVVAYLAIVAVVILIVGPEYGLQQHIEYVHFLGRLSDDFPWRTQSEGFIGYNHSIKQIVVYVLGLAPWSLFAATILKALLLVPLALVALRHLRRPLREPGWQVPQRALDLAFAFYLGAFIWLDMVWELSLGVPLFVYLLGTLERRASRTLVMVSFLPYALLDPWRVFSLVFLLLGWNVIAPGPYVLTDPAIYFPLIMLSILVFYILLLRRLWTVPDLQLRPGSWRAEVSEV
ncbi:MAG: glycosyltransferase 87 family protein [Anaerolineales bacterium]